MDHMRTDDVFSAIANPVRRRILELLRNQSLAAGEIAAQFDLNRPAVSEHLQVLKCVNLVQEEARGRQRFYHLNPTALAEVGDWLHPFEHYWQQRIRALSETLNKEDT
jgi:DNA-binding transcriptional ArsR family regulator